MLLIKETRQEAGVGGAEPSAECTCVNACNSYLQLKCLPGPISVYWVCVWGGGGGGGVVFVRGIPSSTDSGRPELNIKAPTGL